MRRRLEPAAIFSSALPPLGSPLHRTSRCIYSRLFGNSYTATPAHRPVPRRILRLLSPSPCRRIQVACVHKRESNVVSGTGSGLRAASRTFQSHRPSMCRVVSGRRVWESPYKMSCRIRVCDMRCSCRVRARYAISGLASRRAAMRQACIEKLSNAFWCTATEVSSHAGSACLVCRCGVPPL